MHSLIINMNTPVISAWKKHAVYFRLASAGDALDLELSAHEILIEHNLALKRVTKKQIGIVIKPPSASPGSLLNIPSAFNKLPQMQTGTTRKVETKHILEGISSFAGKSH